MHSFMHYTSVSNNLTQEVSFGIVKNLQYKKYYDQKKFTIDNGWCIEIRGYYNNKLTDDLPDGEVK